jgi:two-component system, OmpR family, response regulator RegX3
MLGRVLLVDDEEILRTSLSFALGKEGYEVVAVADGSEALTAASRDAFDLILLDLMLPGVDGMEVCRRLRAHSPVSIIMLTARDQEIDKVLGLELGADDYVTKPFSTRELSARMKAVLRRVSPGKSAGEATGVLTAGRIALDLDRYELTIDGQSVELPAKEYLLLRVLMLHRGHALTRFALIQEVWGDDFMGDAKTLDVHIRWLRQKIEMDPGRPEHIMTVRRVGYRFD